MDVQTLAKQCAEALAAGQTHVLLVVPGGPPNGERVRLIPSERTKCPMGEILNWQDGPPRTLASFEALDILAFLVGRGLISLNDPCPVPLPGGLE